jgi:hypothetical protein
MAKLDPELPSYLQITEALELEDVPLQVSLLTMEIAWMREKIASLEACIQQSTAQIGQADDGGRDQPTD